MGLQIRSSQTEAGKRWREIENSRHTTTIELNNQGVNKATPTNKLLSGLGFGSDLYVQFDPNHMQIIEPGKTSRPISNLAHEVSGHAFRGVTGSNSPFERHREQDAVAVENMFRESVGLDQRTIYEKYDRPDYTVPQYHPSNDIFTLDGEIYNLFGR